MAFAAAGPDEGQPDEAERDPKVALELFPEERALLSDVASQKRIREFSLGRACARRALGALAPPMLPGQADAPILRRGKRAPAWPVGIVGAITHHQGLAAAAAARVGDFRAVGLDMESLRTPSQGLMERILRPVEREALDGLPEEARTLRFMLAFSAKESVFKALHPLREVFLGFQDAEIEFHERGPLEDRGGLTWRLCVDYGAEMPKGFEGEGGYLRQGKLVLTGVWLTGT